MATRKSAAASKTVRRAPAKKTAPATEDKLADFFSVVDRLGEQMVKGKARPLTLTSEDLRTFETAKAAIVNLRLDGGRQPFGDSGHTLKLGLDDLRLIFRALCGCGDRPNGDGGGFIPNGPKPNVTETTKPAPGSTH